MIRSFVFVLLLSLVSPWESALFGEEVLLKRTILVLYDKDDETPEDEEKTNAERYAEMALNQLGLKLAFYEIHQEIPDFRDFSDVRGLLIFANSPWEVKDPIGWLQAIKKAVVEDGIFLVSMGGFSFTSNNLDHRADIDRAKQELMAAFGLSTSGKYYINSYSYRMVKEDTLMASFERPYTGLHPSFEAIHVLDPEKVDVIVSVKEPDTSEEIVWVAITDKGGWAQQGLSLFVNPTEYRDTRKWLINPFLFFQRAYRTDDLPKPDTTTLCGQRIYYSHVDGDGWYNITYIAPYNDLGAYSGEVLLEEVYKVYTDLPVTIGVIAAEIDRDWVANSYGISLAKTILALPHVEVGNHTFTHPFYWGFFKDYTWKKEEPFVHRTQRASWSRFGSYALFGLGADEGKQIKGYDVPRAFALEPFNLEQETVGSIETINRVVAPPEKKVAVYQWSGNTRPFEAAIAALDRVHMPNLNGGDTRFDTTYPSYAWVAPIGRLAGIRRQIYASNSNENTYTNLWKGPFFGFKDLPITFRNTETPIRVKPMNIYYHTYSGEHISSLEAVKLNLDYVMQQEKIPIETSHFSLLAYGFYSTNILQTDESTYQIYDRGHLQTIRFDHAFLQQVDIEASSGVLGQKHLHGSLYVALDPKVETPTIVLEKRDVFETYPDANVPYLIDASWPVQHLVLESDDHFSFQAKGYGAGKFLFHVPKEGLYKIRFKNEIENIVAIGKELYFEIPKSMQTVHIEVERER